MNSQYDRARALVAEQMARLEALLTSLDWMEQNGVSAAAIIDGLTGARPEEANGAEFSRHDRLNGSRRPAHRTSLPEDIDELLGEGGRYTVADMVAALVKRGREFPPNSRHDALVRAALGRCANRYGWKHGRSKPRKWWKAREEASVNGASVT